MHQFLIVLLIGATLGVSGAVAQDEDKPQRRRALDGDRPRANRDLGDAARRGQRMLARLPLMMALDVDRDGTISAEEIAEAATNLKKLDRDGDGKLTAEELRPRGPAAGQQRGRRGDRGAMLMAMFERRDADGDGKLSGDEIPPQLAGRLERIDTDGDEAISESEIEAVQKMIRGRGPGRRGPRDGDRPRGGDGSGVKPKRPGSDG
jgi:Ca2+-binding EF-hand superfamily protein